MGDRVRVIEVESLVEALLTKISRTDAFLRLCNGSWNYESARRDAIVAVCRREGIEAEQLFSRNSKLFPAFRRPSSDIGIRDLRVGKDQVKHDRG